MTSRVAMYFSTAFSWGVLLLFLCTSLICSGCRSNWLLASIFDFGVSARCIIPGSPDSCVRASHWISKCTWRTVSEMLTWKSSVVHITSVNEKALRIEREPCSECNPCLTKTRQTRIEKSIRYSVATAIPVSGNVGLVFGLLIACLSCKGQFNRTRPIKWSKETTATPSTDGLVSFVTTT